MSNTVTKPRKLSPFKQLTAVLALSIVILFILAALFAPFLASNYPLFVIFEKTYAFPLFRYLLYPGYYTKGLDRFFNLLLLSTPLFVPLFFVMKKKLPLFISWAVFLTLTFIYLEINPIKDPAFTPQASMMPKEATWQQEVEAMSFYQRLNLVLDSYQQLAQQKRLAPFASAYAKLLEQREHKTISSPEKEMPTLWNHSRRRLEEKLKLLASNETPAATAKMQWLLDKEAWLEEQRGELTWMILPLLSHSHWEEDVGGSQLFNQVLPWYDLTRKNKRSLLSGLIFGTRISLVVGLTSVLIALSLGVPFGAFAGYFGGKMDLLLSRLLEIWEGMPSFFMLLMIVAVTEVKSVFWVILVIGLFGWTSFARFVRAETLRVKPLAFVSACKTMGFSEKRTLFLHVLPNSLTAVITLLPFSMMAAISSESGLAFLGLGEEGSCSWGVLMDEGRINFPADSALLWPPAILLTLLLVSMALLGDSLRDALDPRSQ